MLNLEVGFKLILILIDCLYCLIVCGGFVDNWSVKAIRRKTTGTGRMRYLRHVPRRFKTGFREGIHLILYQDFLGFAGLDGCLMWILVLIIRYSSSAQEARSSCISLRRAL